MRVLLARALALPAGSLPRLPTALTYLGAGSSAALLNAPAAFAEDAAAAGLPDDTFVVGFAVFLLICTGLLQLSLGDMIADEAQLPSSTALINKNRKSRSSFIKGKK